MRLGARVQTPDVARQVELGAVRPNASQAGDRPLAQRHGEIGVVGEVRARGRAGAACAATAAEGGAFARAAAAAGGDGYFLEGCGPDDLSAKARATVEARDRRAFGRGGDLEVGEARAEGRARLPAGRQQSMVDVSAGHGADVLTDHGTGNGGAQDTDTRRQKGAADSGTGNGKRERGHQSITPGNEKAPATRRRHQLDSGTSETGAPSMAWMRVTASATVDTMPACLATRRAR